MKALADIASVLSGVSPPRGRDGADLYVQIKDLKENGAPSTKGPAPSAKRATRIAVRDLLVASRGDEASVVRPSPRMIGAYAGLDVYLIRPDLDRVDPNYLLIALNSDAALKQLKMAATGGALPRVPKQALENVQLPLPSLDAQRMIAQIGVLARRCETLQTKRYEAQSRLNAAILARLIETAG